MIAQLVAQDYLGVLELPVVISELVQARLAMPVAAVAVPALAAVDNMVVAQAESGVGPPAVID